MRKHIFILAVALALGGCNHDDGGNGGNGGTGGTGGGGDNADMATPNDLEVNTTPPSPTAMHVGATGVTSNLVTAGGHAAYLLNAAPMTSSGTTIGVAGELHVVTFDGTDVTVAPNVLAERYQLAPDGKSIFWISFDPTNGPTSGTASLEYLSLSAGATAKAITGQMPVTNLVQDPTKAAVYSPNPLTMESFFSPSAKYFLVAIAPAKESTEPDLHVIDTSSGMDVYQRPNGAALYSQVVLPDDTMLFQDTAGGTSTSSTPVQTLYWVALPGGTAPAQIATKTASILPTADNKTILILTTGGNLLTWDATNKASAAKPLASNVALLSLGGAATGPVAYVGWDHSVHVVATDGTKKLDLDGATANADLFGAIRLSPDGANVYYFQNAEPQNRRGTLFRAAVAAGATPAHVADKVSLADLAATGDALVFLQNVDDVGAFGDAATAALDGSGVKTLGTKAPVGGLRVGAAGSSWYALHLTGAAAVAANTPIDGSPAITGGLAFVAGGSAADVSLDATVHQGAFGFSDDGLAAVFAAGATWDATAKNWLGALSFIATGAPSTKIDGTVAGVSELGPIAGRSLFVSAPGASPAGIYFVRY
ncbi:MAG: hypothetical protein ACXVAN_03105 [Polyangia bacterium]